MSKLINLIGQKFGRLIVIQRMDNNKWGHARWLCLCNCRNKIIVEGGNLINNHTRSCGCLQKEITRKRSTKHGHTKNGEISQQYNSWAQMIQRCTNPNHPEWRNYGGRGITVCEEWLIFENFDRDIGRGWEPGLTIERNNNELGYFKGNCYWATRKEQARNKRNSRYETYKGKRWLFAELCEKHNIDRKIVYNRYYRYGWDLERALTTPVRKHKKYKKRRK